MRSRPIGSDTRGKIAHIATLGALGAMSLMFGATANASEFDCHNLVRVSGQPIVEGNKGFFFRTTPDLSEYFPIGDRTAALMRVLSSALEARGTSLVYVPVPTKGSVSGPFLPTGIAGMFDQSLARHSYSDFVARLRTAGIHVADIAESIDVKPGEPPTFLGADHHWTSHGARKAAQAVAKVISALPSYDALPKVTFVSTSTGNAYVASSMRRSIQAACRLPLPPNETIGFETKLAGEGTGDGAVDLFGGASAGARISLVGTSFSDIADFNFGGFISQFTGIDVTNFAISGGNQFVSIQSYLTSPIFVEQPPQILVWENPIYNNLGEFGDEPLLELIAAASGACAPDRAKVLVSKPADNGGVAVALDEPPSDGSSLRFIGVDTGDARIRAITADFLASDGTDSVRKIERHPRFKANGRFFIPLPDADSTIRSVILKTDGSSLATASVNFCRYAATEG
jgi:alginate biosynthesis protein AlgX